MRVLALAVDPYDFKDEDSGRQVKGCNLTIVTEFSYPPEDKSSGHPSMKMPMPDDLAAKLRGHLPAVLDLTTTLKKGAGGKATQAITNFQMIGSFDVSRILTAQAQK